MEVEKVMIPAIMGIATISLYDIVSQIGKEKIEEKKKSVQQVI